MQIVRRLASSQQLQPSVATIGNFDGLHLGHQALMARVIEEAKLKKIKASVITFEPMSSQILNRNKLFFPIIHWREKINLFKQWGIEQVILLPFSIEWAKISREIFLDKLVNQYNIRTLVLGEDFKFGHQQSGDIAWLTQHAPLNMQIYVLPTFYYEQKKISSSWIRQAILEKEFTLVKKLLGREYKQQEVL